MNIFILKYTFTTNIYIYILFFDKYFYKNKNLNFKNRIIILNDFWREQVRND